MNMKEAKKFIKDNKRIGVVCPCCGIFMKVYKIRISGANSISLINLVKLYKKKKDYYHNKHFSSRIENIGGGGFAKLCFWGLIERKPNEDGTKKASGLYRPTKKGIKFVNGKILVRKYLYSFNKKITEKKGEKISIEETLGKDFNYKKLMNS